MAIAAVAITPVVLTIPEVPESRTTLQERGWCDRAR